MAIDLDPTAADVRAMQKSLTNGKSLQRRTPDAQRFLRLGGFINKIRTVQGWNMLGPNEVKHLAAVWDEQLERKGVPEELFDDLINRAVDHRLGFLRRGEQAPTISIELILAMYLDYRSEFIPKWEGLISRMDMHERHLEHALQSKGNADKEGRMMNVANSYGKLLPDMTKARVFTTFDELLEDARRQVQWIQDEVEKWKPQAQLLNLIDR